MDLLDDDKYNQKSDDSENEDLKINKRYADKFEKRARYNELQRGKALLVNEEDDEDSEDEESEDEDAELLSPDLDLKIIETINMIKKKDPRIYNKTETFFVENDEDDDDDEDNETEEEHKKKVYKDLIREQLLSKGAEDSEEDEIDANKKSSHALKKGQLIYDREQDEIRKQFLNAAKDVDSDDEGDGILSSKNSKPVVSDVERKKKEEQLKKAILEMKELELLEKKNNNNKSEKDTMGDEGLEFLTNYLKDKKWKQKSLQYSKQSVNAVDDGSDIDVIDEEAVEAAEMFENKYNFRFEELNSKGERDEGIDHMQVVGHARNVEGSLRREDEKRKQQREQRKERKEKERRQREQELRRLKNIQRQLLQERLQKISEIGGLKELGIIDEDFLERDFDPDEHERLMQQQFDEDYYQHPDEDLPDLADVTGAGADADQDAEYRDSFNVDDLAVDEYIDESTSYEKSKKQKKQKKQTGSNNSSAGNVKLPEAMAKSLDMDLLKEKQEVSLLLEKLQQLDYEDIVAGMPCRFKYRQVEAENFGLSTEDILMAEDKELNKYVSLKHLAPYNKRRLDTKDADLTQKRKKLRSAIRQRLHEEELASGTKGSKASKASKTQLTEQDMEVEVEESQEQLQVQAVEADVAGDKKRRRRKKKGTPAMLQVSDDNDQDNDNDNKEGHDEIVHSNNTKQQADLDHSHDDIIDSREDGDGDDNSNGSDNDDVQRSSKVESEGKKKRRKQRGKGKKLDKAEKPKLSKEESAAKRLALYK